jgi:hypothetical protein
MSLMQSDLIVRKTLGVQGGEGGEMFMLFLALCVCFCVDLEGV